jgi:hypothetical protein
MTSLCCHSEGLLLAERSLRMLRIEMKLTSSSTKLLSSSRSSHACSKLVRHSAGDPSRNRGASGWQALSFSLFSCFNDRDSRYVQLSETHLGHERFEEELRICRVSFWSTC